ncbi:spore germination protein [Oceanobacillus iheyensis HTE831]|uniref:Spore germination protein n=3 Tax=Oceanobacillus iheyensis TaxID=182710 RepID=Q8EMS3_OCEIH|nr:spore germination protein [Oceanobacillus iheyensis HTE831]
MRNMGFIDQVKDLQKKNKDLKMSSIHMNGTPYGVIGFESLVDFSATWKMIETLIQNEEIPVQETNVHAEQSTWKKMRSTEQFKTLYEGKVIIWNPTKEVSLIVDPVSRPLYRSIDAPVNESIIYGARDAFTESLQQNIGLLRSKYKSKELEVLSTSHGQRNRKFSFIVLKGTTNEKMVQKIKKKIDEFPNEIKQVKDVHVALGFSKFDLVTRVSSTELPENAMEYIEQGKVVFFMDGYPFGLVLFNTVFDIFKQPSDSNYLSVFVYALYALRIVGIMLSLLLPGLYVALITINPEMLKIQLALSITESRQFVPYPAFIEIMFMLLLIELITEAAVRLPLSISNTIGIVGGIILGQAIVEASLVSGVLIIVIAATTIANGIIVNFENGITLRLMKYFIVIFSALFGILGHVISLLILCSYIARITNFGVPYVRWKKEGIQSENQ